MPATGQQSSGGYYLQRRNAADQAGCKVKSPKNLGSVCGKAQTGCTNPINVGMGNKYQRESDYVGAGAFPLRIERHYNSGSAAMTTWSQGWRGSYGRALAGTVGYANLVRDDGRELFYTQATGQPWVSEADVVGTLTRQVSGSVTTGWTYLNADDEFETYDAQGKLISVTDRAGRTHTLEYSCKVVGAGCAVVTPNSVALIAGLLIKVTDQDGRLLQFTYDSSNRVATITNPAGGVYTYAYSGSAAADNLESVTYPGGAVRQYLYAEATHVSATPAAGVYYTHSLTGIIDESSVRYATWEYDAQGRATSSEHGSGIDKFTIAYTPGAGGSMSSSVTDALNTTRTYGFAAVQNASKNTAVTGADCTDCGAAATAYDANGFVASRKDRNGNLTCYTNNTVGLETQRVEGLAGTTCPGTTVPGVTRTITTTWEPAFRLPDVITESGRTTDFDYDAAGNLIQKTVTSTAEGSTRIWQWTYNANGQVLTADGPRTDVADVTTYTYNTCSTGYGCGQLATVTNALGQVTTYGSYDANGRPLSITDPNGVTTTLTYNFRGQVTSRTEAGETTSFTYDLIGQLTRVTLPDSSYLEYVYDAAHRMTEMHDGLGNKVVYTLDAMGNRTAENTYDPSNSLRRTHSRVYSTVNRLYQDVNAAGTAAVSTTFAYDPNGNLTTTSAPLGRNSTNAYDAVNRLKQVTDPASGTTQFAYDVRDNLTSVTDPKGLVTGYQYNGFGDVKQLTSPDTGVTATVYDSAGNVATSTDARGAVATYGYDALNRVTSIAYGDQTITFGYDAGTNGLGRITAAGDASHALSWSYDARGRVIGKGQTVGGVSQGVGYGYTAGRLASLTMPSGQVVTYGYDTAGRVSSVAVNGTTVLSNVLYEPFGGTAGWTWGNGTYAVRTYDADGKITQVDSGGLKTYAYDDAFRITGITDTVTPANSWTYGYDSLDRLTSGVNASVTRGWTYDANGNRLTETGTAPSTYTYTVAPDSNRVNTISGTLPRTYAYDAAGNTTGYAGTAFTYDNRGRMTSASYGGNSATYVYNALGQRIRRVGPSGTTLYTYDESGHLLGEYDGSGALVQETVWLGDTPVATLRPNGTSVDVYYVHTDHLNTPRLITQPSNNAERWRWDSDPFGTNAPNENPASLGVFKYTLRFPGQQYDGLAGLYYNYFRDYDPAVGRYVESDPMDVGTHVRYRLAALAAHTDAPPFDLNDYGYGNVNPILRIDPFGLDTLMCVKYWHPHAFLCVDGTCSGKYPSGNPISSAGVIRDDSENQSKSSCSAVPNKCPGKSFDDCVKKRLLQRGPSADQYNWASGNCGQWAEDVVTSCRNLCSNSK